VTGYDLVRGNLATLRASGGDFTSATTACLGNNLPATSLPDPSGPPPVGGGFFYVLRPVNCGGPGTYDSGAPSQVGSRDPEINASAGACP
jgi:hypothetical protein